MKQFFITALAAGLFFAANAQTDAEKENPKLLKEKDKADTLLKNLYSINPTYPQDTTELRKSILFLLNSDKKQVLDSTFM